MSRFNANHIFLIGFAITGLFFSGCTKNESAIDSNQIVGSGTLVSETRAVGSFTGIQITSFANVYMTQDTIESLRIESNDNIIGLVVTSVYNNTLVVSLRDGSYSNVTVNVYASMKNIKLLESIGAASFSSTHPIQTDSITCKITGTGSISLTGKTNYESIVITGSGDVRTSNLISSFCSVSISGAGNVEVNVTQRLDATIAGTGTIIYKGNPSVIQKVITGVGVVRSGQ
jgi:hypothetical protein